MTAGDNELLFQPLEIGQLKLPNRILMAPLTRGRATNRVPNELMAEYYMQRASAGLIVSEATAISAQGFGWHGAAGIYTAQQLAGWKLVTDAVHAADGRIFLQLWHMGRTSHPDYHDGELPVAPSPIAAIGQARTPSGRQPYVVPRELSLGNIADIVDDYARAAIYARQAGFDGVEIHGANGYLIDQFLRDAANHRSDRYGGSIENRMRFLREVVEAVAAAWAPERTAVRLSPTMNGSGMSDSNPVELFTQVALMLSKYDLAYLHTAEAIKPGPIYNADAERVTPYIRSHYRGTLLTNGGYDKGSAAQAIRSGQADAITFGRPFLANPDLPERLRRASALNAADADTFYSAGPEGYIDYPAMNHSAPAC